LSGVASLLAIDVEKRCPVAKTGIISIDGHVKASTPTYRHYIEPEHRAAFDEWAGYSRRAQRDAGNIQPDLGDDAQWDPGRRFSQVETQGVIAEILFPNGIPFQQNAFEDAGQAPDPGLTRAGRVAYNRWLADLCSQAPNRLRGQALISFDDVDQAVKDVYWAKESGLGGIMMPALLPGGTFFFDPALDPVWAAIVETGLPLSQHGGSGAPTYTPPGLAAILTLAYEHAFFSGRSLWQLIVGGVFDRFPDLTVVFVETEAYWIGPALQHFDRRLSMDDEWMAFAAYLQRERAFSRTPSEYWETNCYAGISPFDPSQLPLNKMGSSYDVQPGEFTIRAARSMFGVDFPHFESIYPHTADRVTALVNEPTMTAADASNVLCGNAAAIYGVDLEALQPLVDEVGFELETLAVTVSA
jgi:predicted TIM-barrel fold metal-dependent hydrolase